MTDRSKLLALAETVEKLTGPSVHVDADIRDALKLPSDYSVDWRGWGVDEAGKPIERAKAFPYTASLDAAMALVPEGWEWNVWGSGYCRIMHPQTHRNDKDGRSCTPALALCAAALRAQAEALS
ncbi:hypothetical protein [Sphingomonas sp. Leaf10]|uniref:hypothetical protein n=1 Tax=Sphingomonas sp. Leaf10 TaxID=1735676 RepID=UPI0006F407A6|nr:hypothetical protein [Sphingomonas sp. Leaf10]KQM37984.1 hypothetical protein ASE59_11845 [Sphingomonas sp. Leaf10]